MTYAGAPSKRMLPLYTQIAREQSFLTTSKLCETITIVLSEALSSLSLA